MIHLSSEFYAELASEVILTSGRVVEFTYQDTLVCYDVIYGYRSNPAVVLMLKGWRVVSNDFSLPKLEEWLEITEKIKK